MKVQALTDGQLDVLAELLNKPRATVGVEVAPEFYANLFQMLTDEAGGLCWEGVEARDKFLREYSKRLVDNPKNRLPRVEELVHLCWSNHLKDLRERAGTGFYVSKFKEELMRASSDPTFRLKFLLMGVDCYRIVRWVIQDFYDKRKEGKP